MIEELQGTPQQPDPNRPGIVIPVHVRFDAPEEGEVEVRDDRKTEVRRMKITAEMLRKHGYTEGCEGCKFKETGVKVGARTHSERCRKRIMEAISQEEEGFERIRRDQERMDWRKKAQEQESKGAEQEVMEVESEEELMEVDDEEKVKMLYKVIGRIEEEQVRQLIKEQSPDLAEMYSPPRVVKEAAKYNLMAGASIDLTNGWDFNLKTHRDAAERYVREFKPKLIIGSPECRMFSALQNLRKWGKKAEAELEAAKEHIRFVVKLYRIQVESGRWFLHEHPAGATSWQMAEVVKLSKEAGVVINVADQCMYGFKTPREGNQKEQQDARKRIKFMTNSFWLGLELKTKCDGSHRHQHLMGGRAKAAAVYPQGLCQAICAGLRNQLDNGAREVQQLKCLMSVKASDKVEPLRAGEKGVEHEEDDQVAVRQAWDDVSGKELNAKEVGRARMKEI